MSWWPGRDTDIGIIFFLIIAVGFICSVYKISMKIFGEKTGERIAEFILGVLTLFGLLKGCGII